MEGLDLTSAVGIGAFVSFVVLALKSPMKRYLTDRFRKACTIILVFGLSQLVSYIALWIGVLFPPEIVGEEVVTTAKPGAVAYIGIQASFIAIGGFEGLKQMFNLVRPENKNTKVE